MENQNVAVDASVKTIVRNKFESALGDIYESYQSARSKNPNSGTWIIESTKIINRKIQHTIEECLSKIDKDISEVFRTDPRLFWDHVALVLKEKVYPTMASIEATITSQNQQGPAPNAIKSGLSQATFSCINAVDTKVGELFHKDNLKQLERSLNAKTDPIKPLVNPVAKTGLHEYVSPSRILELRGLKYHDSMRLIRMCEELNKSFSAGCFLSTAVLLRAILDHVFPIFGVNKFSEVANNYPGSKSFKDSMLRLEESSRKIADAHLHTPIRKKEVLPTSTQVDFSNELDVLLSEIVRVGV